MAMWWPLAAWLSPAAAWFLFFNAVVGAIAVMSSSGGASAHHQAPPAAAAAAAAAAARRRLCRSGSSVLLDRLRSFSIFAVHPVAGGVATGAPLDGGDATATAAASDSHGFYCYGTREAEAAATAAQVIAPEQPERIPQAVDAPAGETAGTSSAAPPSAHVPPAPAEEDRAAPVAPAPAPEAESEEDDKAEAEAAAEEEEAEQDDSISLDEAYALAQRRRAQDQASPPLPPPPSQPAPATATAKKAAAEGVSRRRRNKAEDAHALDGKAELNARAELFIRQFREELKLQRINSILSHAHALRSPTAAAR
ncbi:unnamed protein product [Urochloa humidicola]